MWATNSGHGTGLLNTLAPGLSVDPVRLTEPELREALAEVLVGVDRLNARAARLLAEVTERGLADVRGESAPRPATFLRDRAPAAIGRAEAGRVARRARVRVVLPRVAKLFDAGEVSTAFVDAACAGLGKLEPEVWELVDEVLAGEARVIEPCRVGAVIEQARVMTDTEDADARGERLDGRSRVYLSRVGSDGAWALNGTLYGVEAERFALMLDTYGRQAAGWRKPGPEDRALGLFQMARVAERAVGDPEFRNPPRGHHTHLVVLATTAACAGEPGAPAATTAEGLTLDPGLLAAMRCATTPDVLISDTRLPAEFTTGGISDSETGSGTGTGTGGPPTPPGPMLTPSGPIAWPSEAVLLQRSLVGLARTGGSHRLEPLAYGRAKRRATQAIYDALIARDRGCVIPLCERGPTWTDVHHLLEVAADDGPTDIEALALVCFPDHNAMHRRGQHLHPPWCACQPCQTSPDKQWRLRTTLPVIDSNPRVLRSGFFGAVATEPSRQLISS